VLTSCITACGKCVYCPRKLMYSHCNERRVDSRQQDRRDPGRVRSHSPYAETSLYPVPAGADEEAWAMLSHFLPTGFECGVLNGKIQPGDSVAIVGSRSPSRSFG
jgi:alcohol dehydrogenase